MSDSTNGKSFGMMADCPFKVAKHVLRYKVNGFELSLDKINIDLGN